MGKFYIFYRIEKLIILTSLFIDFFFMKANRKEYQVWLSENRRSQLIGKLYFYSCWAAAGSAGTLPLIFMAYEYYKGIEIKQKLPFGGK